MSANERHWLLSTLGWKKPLVRIAALRVRLSCTTRDRAWFTMHEWRLPCRNFVYSRLIFFLFFLSFLFTATLIFFFIKYGSENIIRISFSKWSRRDTMNKTDISTCPISWILEIFNGERVRDEFGGRKKRQYNEASLSLSTIHEIFNDYSTDRDNT